jgi:hypothetical protein
MLGKPADPKGEPDQIGDASEKANVCIEAEIGLIAGTVFTHDRQGANGLYIVLDGYADERCVEVIVPERADGVAQVRQLYRNAFDNQRHPCRPDAACRSPRKGNKNGGTAIRRCIENDVDSTVGLEHRERGGAEFEKR